MFAGIRGVTVGAVEQRRQPHQGRRIAWEGARQHARKDILPSKLIVSPARGGFDKGTTTTMSSSPPIPPPLPPAAVPSRQAPQMTDDDFTLGALDQPRAREPERRRWARK